MSEPWFGAKRYGIGLGPRSPAGWISTGVYVLLMVSAPIAGRSLNAPIWAVEAAPALLTVGFIALAILKSDGRPWRWRWGGR